MVTEDYVSFETAKLLKEKGFNEETEYVYSNDGELLRLCHFGINDLTNTDCNDYHTWQFPIEGVVSIISAPTLQMTMKWLREREWFICVVPLAFYCGTKTWKFGYNIWAGDNLEVDELSTPEFNTYEEACEAAIKYCLEKLI